MSGTVWNEDVIYNPYSGTGNYTWNFFGLNYSVNSATADKGQYVPLYGQALKYGNAPAQLWGGVFEVHDMTGAGLASAAEARVGVEIDMVGNGALNGGQRTGLAVILKMSSAGTAPVQGGQGISVLAPSQNSAQGSLQTGISIGGQITTAAIDLSYVTMPSGGVALHLPDNLPVALSTDGKACVYWDAPSERFKLSYNGKPVFSVDASGNVKAAGTYLASTAP